MRHNRILLLLILGLFSGAPQAQAFTNELASSLPREILSETVPFTFAPNDFSAADFEAIWLGPSIPGMRLRLGAESFEWVRASDLFLLPRGRLIAETDDAAITEGQLNNLGFVQSLVNESGKWRAELPVALLSGSENPIDVRIIRGGKEIRGRIGIRFKPRPEVMSQRLITDPACSPYRVQATELALAPDQWAYVGCRFVVSQGDLHRTSALEVYVYWEGAPKPVRIDGLVVEPKRESVWSTTLRAAPGHLTFSSEHEKIALDYSIADHLHSGSIAMGVGPYAYRFDAPDAQSDTLAPLLTIYGSYFYSETLRIVGFNATTFNHNYTSETGLYVHTEQFKMFDKRYQVKLLLGARAAAFRALGKNQFIFGAPQGAELLVTDFAKKRYNLSAGSFLFPPINGKAYYNLWLRWGTNRFFGELNYIAWQEKIDDQRVYSRSVGISFGGPLFSFF